MAMVMKNTAIMTAADTQIRTNDRLSFRGILMEDITMLIPLDPD